MRRLLEEEEDVEELDDPMSTRPPAIEDLQRCTGFDKRWLMFLYRNFKQHCANGRMTDVQWRQLLRLLFPRAADDRFADRLFRVIARDRPHLVFKDLVMCLWDLTEGGRSASAESPGPSTTAAFAFQLMTPDDKGRVCEEAFVDYVKSVFALCARKNGSSNALGLPIGSIYRTKSVERVGPPSPVLRRWAIERFRILDKDCDGFLTISDIESEVDDNRLTLPTLADLDRPLQITHPQSQLST